MNAKRFCKVIGLKEEKQAEYESLHAAVWPGVNAMIKACHIDNFSIFSKRFPDGKLYLILYFEYSGTDLAADMKKMGDDPETQRWWKLTDPCQEPFADRPTGEWWVDLQEVCHLP